MRQRKRPADGPWARDQLRVTFRSRRCGSPYEYEQNVAHGCASKNKVVQMPCSPKSVKLRLRPAVARAPSARSVPDPVYRPEGGFQT